MERGKKQVEDLMTKEEVETRKRKARREYETIARQVCVIVYAPIMLSSIQMCILVLSYLKPGYLFLIPKKSSIYDARFLFLVESTCEDPMHLHGDPMHLHVTCMLDTVFEMD